MKMQVYLFDQQFLKRFSICPIFFLLSGSFVSGIISGTIAVKLFGLLENQTVLSMFFSAAPAIKAGYLNCFSDILLNVLIFLIAIFLLGVTAFGAFGIPLLMFYKGSTIAVNVLSLLAGGTVQDLGCSALCFTPVWAVVSLLLILFATRALVFSGSLARAGFSQQQETVDFKLYFKDFIYFLCFSVVVSAIGSLLAAFYGLL